MLVTARSAVPRGRRQAGIGGEPASVVEVTEQAFRGEDRGRFRAEPLETGEHRHRSIRRIGCQNSVAFGFKFFDLRDDQLEPVQLAHDLGEHVWRDHATVTCSQRIEPLPPVAAHRLAGRNPLREAQALIRLMRRARSPINTLRSRFRRRWSF